MAIKESSPKFLGSLRAARRFQPLNELVQIHMRQK